MNIGAFGGGGGTELFDVLHTDDAFSTDNGHPLSSYLSATNLAGVDPSASGYEIFLYSFGDVSLPTNPVFSTGVMPVGTVFTSFITTDDTKTILFDSPNSEGLLVTASAAVPEPKDTALLLAALLSVAGLVRRKLARA
jgi:hypothetical protein